MLINKKHVNKIFDQENIFKRIKKLVTSRCRDCMVEIDVDIIRNHKAPLNIITSIKAKRILWEKFLFR